MATSEKPSKKERDPSKVHKLSLKGSARLVAEFVRSILCPPRPPIKCLAGADGVSCAGFK